MLSLRRSAPRLGTFGLLTAPFLASLVACGGGDDSSTTSGGGDGGSSAARDGATHVNGDAGGSSSGGNDGDASVEPTADGGGGGGGNDATTSSGGDAQAGSDAASDAGATAVLPARCNGSVHSAADAGAAPPKAPAITVQAGFKLESIASVSAARELAALPNGDLLVATDNASVYLVPNADSDGAVGAPVLFTTINEGPTQGVAYDAATCTAYVATTKGLYSIPYADGQVKGTAGAAIAQVRTGTIAPNRPAGDTDNHTSTSVAVAGGKLYAGVGSSCNACAESDPTRASIQGMGLDGAGMATRATRFRNPIALIENPQTGTLWAGGAGQDGLPTGHPYEFFDAVTSHPGVADYGWPACEENQHAYTAGADCSKTVAPLIEFPAYQTLIGAAFYPKSPSGAHAFPASYRGGVFITGHGSWHTAASGKYETAPRVAFVAMNGDVPATPVNWSDPTVQWKEFIGGFQTPAGTARIGRPTGIAVGPSGSLFVSDDQTNLVYRIRPQ